ncbi:MAG: dTDP-4-dehydrorhamnose reductase [Bacteroidales bacterium]
MKTILVTGGDGQLGQSLNRLKPKYARYKFVFTDVDTLNICDKDAVEAFILSLKDVGYIINCAAYTDVDKAEKEAVHCLNVNKDGVRNLGEVAAASHIRIIHLSTDYVFDGANSVPYVETDYTSPLSMYGRSKREGELMLQAVCPSAIIIRTAWLYSEFGNNFVSAMLQQGKACGEVGVALDQTGAPTYAGDLAHAILSIVKAAEAGFYKEGIYHYANEGVCSRYDWARKIFQFADLPCRAVPISAKDYPAAALRPAYSVLCKEKIRKTWHLTIPHWEDSLADFFCICRTRILR